MRVIFSVLAAVATALSNPIGLLGQSAQTTSSASVPRLINVTGVYQPADGQPPPAGTVLTVRIYAAEQGGAPLWQETQHIVLDKSGRFSLLLGAAQADGIPLEVFASGEAQWLALHFAGPGEVEGPRTRITSVPYALRSSDADTLGGHPASAYQLAPTDTATGGHAANAGTSTATGTTPSGTAQPNASPNDVLAGTPNLLAKYVTTADVGSSAIFESGGLVGINTTTPSDALHVRFTNTNGGMTGLAVQNLGNTATSFSGTLFYDQNGALGQFQGFNNVTHEYRINNIAKTGVVTDGSINFMIGGTSRFFVTPANIGIGTTAPVGELEVSNALNPGHAAAILGVTSFGSTGFGSQIVARKARGTVSAPSAVLSNDTLASWIGQGYGATGFGTSQSGISLQAVENWTDAAQGTFMNFSTTTAGTNLSQVRMTLTGFGSLGIGTTGPAANLEVSNATNTSPFGMILGSSFTGSTGAGTLFVGRKARGTAAAPTAVQNGDSLAAFLAEGYGATTFSGTRGGMFVQAAESWTDAAQGTRLAFNTTATGTTAPGTKMVIDDRGNVGMGLPTPFPAAPLEISRTGTDSGALLTVYTSGNAGNANPFYSAQLANGTPAAPTAAQTGDILGVWVAGGYGSTQFGGGSAGMGVIAEENFTDTAQGAAAGLFSTPTGGNQPVLHMAVLPVGNVGIGDWVIPGGSPTAADRLQVFGDIRVGTAGTNGCLKNFAGTGITGTCSSDRRLKRNITPFGSVLTQLTALQPVHFQWRAAEFPDRHFGETQAYGLIAQDVEQVLPELVVTGEDGFKQVDYAKLPLLTIQAVKELKERVAELERLIQEMRATSPGR